MPIFVVHLTIFHVGGLLFAKWFQFYDSSTIIVVKLQFGVVHPLLEWIPFPDSVETESAVIPWRLGNSSMLGIKLNVWTDSNILIKLKIQFNSKEIR